MFDAFYSAGLEVQTTIALAGTLGMRRNEITVLHTRDRVGGTLKVHGKGDRVRFVPLNDLALELLVELERRQGSGEAPAPLDRIQANEGVYRELVPALATAQSCDSGVAQGWKHSGDSGAPGASKLEHYADLCRCHV